MGRTTRILILISFLFHVLAALKSTGYFQYDEHFQVLEWVSWKLGWTPTSALAWEFPAQIRPWFLPALFTAIAKGFLFFGPVSGADLALTYRVLLSLLGWASLVCFVRSFDSLQLGARERRLATWGVLLLFCLPFLHARTSSENLGGSLFLMGFSLWFWKERRHLFWISLSAGLALGLSFESRFQMALAIVPLLAGTWRKLRGIQGKGLFIGLLLAFGIGRLCDYWGYGAWTFTPWNYFYQNLVEGKASSFGVLPVWGYFLIGFQKDALGPFGTLGLLVMVFFWIRHPRHPVTLATAPFFLVHCLIGHKEMRFLYPLAPFLPLAFADGWGKLGLGNWKSQVAKGLLGLNGILLIYFSSIPCKNPSVFQEYVSRRFGQGSLTLYATSPDPMKDVLDIYFYRPKDYRYVMMDSAESSRRQAPEDYFLFRPRPDLAMESHFGKCKLEFETVPSWLMRYNFNGWADRVGNWSLYRCQRLDHKSR